MRQFIILIIMLTSTGVATAQHKLMTQGHRGCRGLMPENTIAAMKKAIDLGTQVLELDVVISKDKQVVVSHDSYIAAAFSLWPNGRPVTAEDQKKLILYSMNYDEIKKFDVGSKHNSGFPQQQNFPAYKPLLAELIDSADLYAKQQGKPLPFYNIEIKSEEKTDGIEQPAPPEFVQLVMAIPSPRKMNNRMNIQSFDVRPLQLLHKQHPEVQLSYLTANAKSVTDNLNDLGFTPTYYSPYYKTVTADVVKLCHDKGIQIIPWTVNTRPEIDQLVALGVDGIISDYPNLFE